MPSITRRPLRLSLDAERDILLAHAHGRVPHPCLDTHTADVTCWLSFLLRKPGGSVIGFVVDGISELDVHDHCPDLWGPPFFEVPVLGLTQASVAEIVLRTRATFGCESTADVLAMQASREYAEVEDHARAEREIRLALGTGDLRAHLTLAGCLCVQGRYAESYDEARIYTELAPRDSWGFAWMGRAALEMGDEDEAIVALKRAVRLEREGSHRTPAKRVLKSLRSRG